MVDPFTNSKESLSMTTFTPSLSNTLQTEEDKCYLGIINQEINFKIFYKDITARYPYNGGYIS